MLVVLHLCLMLMSHASVNLFVLSLVLTCAYMLMTLVKTKLYNRSQCKSLFQLISINMPTPMNLQLKCHTETTLVDLNLSKVNIICSSRMFLLYDITGTQTLQLKFLFFYTCI